MDMDRQTDGHLVYSVHYWSRCRVHFFLAQIRSCDGKWGTLAP
jgi:hypothetical protein